jgi:hypothetical protein
MKFLECFSNIDSKVKNIVKSTKYCKKIKIFFENNKKITIVANADCCSMSYFHEFNEFQFSLLVGKKIKSLKETKNKKIINSLYKNSKIHIFRDNNVNTYHLYEIKFTNNKIFYFGLINASNGFYDGWISILE